MLVVPCLRRQRPSLHMFNEIFSFVIPEEVLLSPVSVCPLVSQQGHAGPLCAELGGGMGRGPGKSPLHSGADPDHVL